MRLPCGNRVGPDAWQIGHWRQIDRHDAANIDVDQSEENHMVLKIKKNKSPTPPIGCDLTECMSMLAGAWAPNVIWHLRAGPRRFNELRIDIPPISAKVLSARLKELQARHVVDRQVKPTSPPSVEYRLTELGKELVPALEAIVTVGHKLKDRA